MRKALTYFLLLLLTGCGSSIQSPTVDGNTSPGGRLADGWVSSGGELLRDGRNPWFLKNTKEVKYCIRIDGGTVSASETFVDEVFQIAVKAWRNDIARVIQAARKYTANPEYDADGVGSQTFRKVGCGQDPDLDLILGYGAFTAHEKRNLPEVEKFAAFTIRTKYDPVNLKGKGFIYLGSETGEHRFRQEAFTTPWSRKDILGLTLLHEIGHVLGIPHLSSKELSVMKEDYVDGLFEGVNRDGAFVYDLLEQIPMLAGNLGGMMGVLGTPYHKDSKFYRFFEMTSNADSRLTYNAYKKNPAEDEDDIAISKILIFDPNWMRKGKRWTIDIATIENTKTRLKLHPVASVYLTTQQTVFPNVKYEKGLAQRDALHRLQIQGIGEATLGGGKKKSVRFEFGSHSELILFGMLEDDLEELTLLRD